MRAAAEGGDGAAATVDKAWDAILESGGFTPLAESLSQIFRDRLMDTSKDWLAYTPTCYEADERYWYGKFCDLITNGTALNLLFQRSRDEYDPDPRREIEILENLIRAEYEKRIKRLEKGLAQGRAGMA